MKNYESYFVAKQPILDSNLSTYGYELLFRSAAEQSYAVFNDPDQAIINVVTCGLVKSQEDLAHTKLIFITFTEKLLLTGAPKVLPASITVIEILGNIAPSQELIDEIIKYKQDGYLIALDDYTGDNFPHALMDRVNNAGDIMRNLNVQDSQHDPLFLFIYANTTHSQTE